MRVAEDAPRRPAVRYYGGKFRIAPWVISHFPPHYNYVELCGGGASVLLQKERSPVETYNDIDSNVVNYFAMLRDRPDELLRAIDLTPFAREEYELHREPTDDPIERARRFWVGCNYSVVYLPYTKSGFGVAKSDVHSGGASDASVYRDMEPLLRVAQRLKGVQIENKSYQEIVQMYDAPNNLLYFDPPYVQSERASPNEYTYNWDEIQHLDAAAILLDAESYVVVSGYRCDLYEKLYEKYGWHRIDKDTIGNGGSAGGQRTRTESLWLSPRTMKALRQDLSDLPLFGGVP